MSFDNKNDKMEWNSIVEQFKTGYKGLRTRQKMNNNNNNNKYKIGIEKYILWTRIKAKCEKASTEKDFFYKDRLGPVLL